MGAGRKLIQETQIHHWPIVFFSITFMQNLHVPLEFFADLSLWKVQVCWDERVPALTSHWRGVVVLGEAGPCPPQRRLCRVKVMWFLPALGPSTLWDPMDYTVHGILQARKLEWVAFPFSRGSSQPRDRTQVSRTALWVDSLPVEPQGKPGRGRGWNELIALKQTY